MAADALYRPSAKGCVVYESNSRWIFVLGVNNSGTGLLEELIARHPSVLSLPREGQILSRSLPRPWELGVQRLWTQRLDIFRLTDAHSGDAAVRARSDWMAYFRGKGSYFLEKSPPRTIQSRWLDRWFPQAYLIAVVRSPYAVCEGMRRREGCDLESAAIHWRIANQLMIDDLPLVGRSLLLRYEELVCNTTEQLSAIQRFLDLQQPFDSQTLAEPFQAPNHQEEPLPIQNLNAQSLRQLSDADKRTIEYWTGDLRRRLGY